MELTIKYVNRSELTPNPRNPRKNDKAATKLAVLLKEHGFTNPIIALPNGMILAGHTRLKAAEIAGIEKVPVIYKDFPKNLAAAYAISDNRSAEWSEWDYPVLKDIITEIDTGEFDISLTGFDQGELEEMFGIVGKDNIKEKELDENIDTKNHCPKCDYEW